MAECLYSAQDCITAVPLERWDVEAVEAPTDILQVGGNLVVTAFSCIGQLARTFQVVAPTGQPIVPWATLTEPYRCPPAPPQSGTLRFAAWMAGASLFDEGLFRLSRSEAIGLDPQCRLLLEYVWAAVQVCGVHTAQMQPVAAWGHANT